MMREDVNIRGIICAFASAVDMVNPILKNHHRRVAILSYHIGKELELTNQQMVQLILAASLHDIGALTLKDRAELMDLDVQDPRAHEELGCLMLSSFPPFEVISKIILNHHVRFCEHPDIEGGEIGIESYILHLADRIDILINQSLLALNQKDYVLAELEKHKDQLFAPSVYKAFMKAQEKDIFWFDLEDITLNEVFDRLVWDEFNLQLGIDLLEKLVYTLSRVIDFKSHFTVAHSARVAHVAYRLAEALGYDDTECRYIKIAGYLHDIGKVAVPAELLIKAEDLSQDEFNLMKRHPYYTRRILKEIKGFEKIAEWASAHHENRQATGYPSRQSIETMDIEAEIIAYADVFSALSENRPYRKGMPLKTVMNILEEQYVKSIGERVFETLANLSSELYCEINMLHEEIRETYKQIKRDHGITSREHHYLKLELYELVQKDMRIFEFIQEGSLDGMWYWDLQHPENEWMNNRFWTIIGYEPSEMKHLASEWQDIIFKEDLALALENFNRHCSDASHPYDQVVRYRHKDGHTVWIRCRGIAIRNKDGAPIRMLGAHTDITEIKELQEALKQKNSELVDRNKEIEKLNDSLVKLSTIDHLTGLYNRHMVDQYLIEEVKRVKRSGKVFSLLMIDINKFKRINDTYGHLVGDEVLIDFANRLKQMLRGQDIVSRWGGDEFLIVLPETPHMNAVRVRDKLLSKSQDWCIVHDDAEISYSVSIGVSSCEVGEELNTCLKRADEDLYYVKYGTKS